MKNIKFTKVPLDGSWKSQALELTVLLMLQPNLPLIWQTRELLKVKPFYPFLPGKRCILNLLSTKMLCSILIPASQKVGLESLDQTNSLKNRKPFKSKDTTPAVKVFMGGLVMAVQSCSGISNTKLVLDMYLLNTMLLIFTMKKEH